MIRGARELRGKTCRQLASHLDLFPTICGAADVHPADDLPGIDLLAMLREEPGTSREAVYSELATCVMIRTLNWKLVFDPEQGGVQYLFNLRTDPREERNLAGDPAYDGVRTRLVERLLSNRILLTQYTHDKEEQRLQRVRAPGKGKL